jgi:uncharacterized protein (DUF2147 family)
MGYCRERRYQKKQALAVNRLHYKHYKENRMNPGHTFGTVARRKTMKIGIFLLFILLSATTALAAVPGNILGAWKTDGGDSKVELIRCGDKICGKIIWLKVPRYIDRVDGPVGKIKVDRKSPDKSQRNRPILGLQVIKGLTATGNNLWENGLCYDPESGRSYTCKMKLASPDRLELRGYIGVSLIGRTFSLTR